jgi:ribosomal protein L11 methylase PrmA
LANLIADNAKKLWASVKPGGTLILSGLLKEELASTAKHFPASPKAKIKATKLGKWGVLMIKKL